MTSPRSLSPFALVLTALLACQPGGPPPAPTPAPPPAAATASTTAPTPAVDADQPLLRTYSVPVGQSRSIEQALASALSTGKDTPPLGTVERLPDGRLVVVAPPGIQDGIAALIRDLDASNAPPVRTAEFDYWIVLGEPADAAQGLDAVPDLAPALQAITETQGPMKFSVLESMRLSSLLDERGEADSERLYARQVITEVGGRLIADLDVSVALGAAPKRPIFCHNDDCKQLKSRVHLDPGQLLVVGQATVDAPEGKGASVPKTMFYVVRGRLRSGGV